MRQHRDVDHSVNAGDVVGASESLISGRWEWPVHGLRHPPTRGTSGWYVWTGDLSDADDFFRPWHAGHLVRRCPEVAPCFICHPVPDSSSPRDTKTSGRTRHCSMSDPRRGRSASGRTPAHMTWMSETTTESPFDVSVTSASIDRSLRPSSAVQRSTTTAQTRGGPGFSKTTSAESQASSGNGTGVARSGSPVPGADRIHGSRGRGRRPRRDRCRRA